MISKVQALVNVLLINISWSISYEQNKILLQHLVMLTYKYTIVYCSFILTYNALNVNLYNLKCQKYIGISGNEWKTSLTTTAKVHVLHDTECMN